jgi:hypothetical protein
LIEIIALLLKKVEKLMEKYGFWKVASVVLAGILIWQLSGILEGSARIIEVMR